MQIHTERLILRHYREDDWKVILTYQSKPLYLRYYEWRERKPESAREFLQMYLDLQKQIPRIKYQLVITLKATGQLIGSYGIRMREPGTHEANIGYELDPAFWNQGYASEAASSIVDFDFSHFNLHRIWFWCVADNVGSANVLEKLGMKMEGHQRDKEFYRGRYWDVLLYAILDAEWQQRSMKPEYKVVLQ